MATDALGSRRLDYKRKVAIVYVLGLFIQIIDGTIVNIALPTLADEFGVDSTEVEWTVVGYALAVAVVIPVAGWLGDRFGTKRMFLIALAGFVAASALCGAAGTLDQLIVFRIVQGMFAGLITPIGSAMLFRAYPLSERAKAATAVIGVAVIAPAIGPVLGGVLIETLSWRWIFYVNIPIGAVGLVLGVSWLRDDGYHIDDDIDLVGVVLSSIGLATLLFGMTEGAERGWTSPEILASLLVSAVAITVLVFHELRIENPVLALRLFADRLFRAINLAAAPAYAAFFSLILLMPIFLQKVSGESALVTGLVLLPQPLGVIISSQIAGRRLYGTVGPRPLLFAGSIGAFLASVYYVSIDETTSLAAIAVVMFLRGFAMGFVFIAIQTAVYATVPKPDLGRATSLFSTQRQTSVAFGFAVAATVLASTVSSLDPVAAGGSTVAERVDGFRVAFLVSASLFLVSAAASFLVRNEDAAETMVARSTPATRTST